VEARQGQVTLGDILFGVNSVETELKRQMSSEYLVSYLSPLVQMNTAEGVCVHTQLHATQNFGGREKCQFPLSTSSTGHHKPITWPMKSRRPN
jgi:hypothetical protein